MRIKITFCIVGTTIGLLLSGCATETSLFNGRNLDNWKPYLENSDVNPAAVWSVQDGVLRCEGKPSGYIRTTEEYSNYKLHVEWRWVDEPSNSGILLHATGEDKLWPLCVEAQLMHENAGDFVTIQNGSAITVNGERHSPPADLFYKIISKQHNSSEYPPGQWNHYDIVCKGSSIQLTVNSVLQNTAAKSTLTSGAISLQSEGSPIEFRNIRLEPLKHEE
jgi:hypothetical protein